MNRNLLQLYSKNVIISLNNGLSDISSHHVKSNGGINNDFRVPLQFDNIEQIPSDIGIDDKEKVDELAGSKCSALSLNYVNTLPPLEKMSLVNYC